MNKLLLAFGIILCFAGLILISSSNMSVKTTQLSAIPSTMKEQGEIWEYSVYFNSSETVWIEIRGPKGNPNIWWFNDLYDPETDSNPFWNPYAPVKLNITLFPPDDVETVYCISFVWNYLEGLTVKNLELIIGNTNSLENLNLTYTYTRGIIKGFVKENGIYSFHVSKWYWMKVGGVFYPPELEFYKEVIADVYPYSNLQPVGISILILGVMISTFGFFKKKKSRRYAVLSKRTKKSVDGPYSFLGQRTANKNIRPHIAILLHGFGIARSEE